MADRDHSHRGWSTNDGRNEGLQDHNQRTQQLNRESNQAQFARAGQGGQGHGGYGQTQGGGYGGPDRSGAWTRSPGGFGQGGGGQDHDLVRGDNSYAPGAEIWQDGSNYNPTGYHRQQGGYGGGAQQGGGYGQAGFGASSGGGNYGAGGFGQQGQGSQGANYPQGFDGGQGGYGGQAGGSYGQGDYSESARRSTYRQDQNYGGPHQAGGGYQGRQGHEDHDPDYLSWRDSQLSSYDREYSAWREEQRKKHDEEYGKWRSERKETFGQKFHEWRTKAASAVGLGGHGGDKTGAASGEEHAHTAPNPLNVGDNPNVVDVADGGTGDRNPKNN
jgi:hypothetical protein